MTNNFPKIFRTVVYIFLIAFCGLSCKKKETTAEVKITNFAFDDKALYDQGDSIYFELSAESNVNVEDVLVSLMVKKGNTYIQVVGRSFVQKIRFPSVSGYLVVPDVEKYDVSDFILRAYVAVGDAQAVREAPILVRLANSPLYAAMRKDGSQWRVYDLQGDSLLMNVPSTHANVNWFTVNERRHTLLMYNDNAGSFEQWNMQTGMQETDLGVIPDAGLVKMGYDRNYDLYFTLYSTHWTSHDFEGGSNLKSVNFSGGITPYAMVGNGGRIAIAMQSANANQRGIYLFNYQGQEIGFIQDESSEIFPFAANNELFVIANRASKTVLYPLTTSGKGNEIELNKGKVTGVYVDRVLGSTSVTTDQGIYELQTNTGTLSFLNDATNVKSFVAVKSDDLIGFTTPEGVFSARFNALNGTSKRTLPACLKITYSL